MTGMIINIAIPSLERIREMDKEFAKSLLLSAVQTNLQLAIYINTLHRRLEKEDL